MYSQFILVILETKFIVHGLYQECQSYKNIITLLSIYIMYKM